jgi:hypothetical protein
MGCGARAEQSIERWALGGVLSIEHWALGIGLKKTGKNIFIAFSGS